MHYLTSHWVYLFSFPRVQRSLGLIQCNIIHKSQQHDPPSIILQHQHKIIQEGDFFLKSYQDSYQRFFSFWALLPGQYCRGLNAHCPWRQKNKQVLQEWSPVHTFAEQLDWLRSIKLSEAFFAMPVGPDKTDIQLIIQQYTDYDWLMSVENLSCIRGVSVSDTPDLYICIFYCLRFGMLIKKKVPDVLETLWWSLQGKC